MPTALRHKISIPGVVLPWRVVPREVQRMNTKFWGLTGESSIFGGTAGRTLEIPVLVYDENRFVTRQSLSRFIDRDLNLDMVGEEATLTVESDAARPPFQNASFEGCVVIDGPKLDEAGSLGGGAWAICVFIFRQHK